MKKSRSYQQLKDTYLDRPMTIHQMLRDVAYDYLITPTTYVNGICRFLTVSETLLSVCSEILLAVRIYIQ